jgi:hypothetical protein
MPDETNGNLRAVYQQLCDSYRTIDDFHAKLLGFLPLVSGGVFLLTASTDFAKDFLGLIGIFGVAVTLGLLCYEINEIKQCHYLIVVGEQIERQFGIRYGQFRGRPSGVARYFNEPLAAGVIYPAVLAAWAYLALDFTLAQAYSCIVVVVPIIVFFTGFLGLLAYNISLQGQA